MGTQKLKPSAVVAPAQSNYGEYTLPPMLRGLSDPPLYLAVAIWGWQLGRPFCRQELAQTFRITLRRAGDVMSYIRRADQKKIRSQQWYERGKKGARCRHLQIVAEPMMAVKKTMRGTPTPETVACLPQDDEPPSEAGVQALRRWFLNRPNPG
ncbi:CaiF/GrlA family transcriptional regulator [Serratia proteamaculans]|uniref:CaiF/GrlA family transcriptional regulator n=1 Tax=Serratia proteamaculans TaxID=28151 RepID=UPI003703EE15